LRKEADNVPGQISVLNHIAEIYSEQNDFSEAVRYYEEAMILASGLQDKAMIANIYLGISDAFCMQDQFKKAYDEVAKAERIASSLQNQDLLNRVNLLKGKVLFRLNRINESERYFDDLMLEVSNSGDLAIEKEARYYLALLYKSTGRYEKAFDQFQQHHELAAALENAEHARLIERLEARIQIENAEQEKRVLVAEKAAVEANEEKLKLQNVLLIGGILAAFIIMVMLFLINNKRQKTNIKLIQKNKYIAEQRAEIQDQNEYIAAQNVELKQGNERLKKLNNEKDTLMNILAHDLKAPFNRIKGLVQLMELSEINDEQKKYVELLDGSADNGLALIRDLLEVSAFSGKEKQPVFQDLSLMKQLTEKKESFHADAASKHIDILIDLKEDIHLPADPSYLSRILDNLISNAIKFSEPGKKIILSGGQDNGAAFISVKDFGPGFSKKDKKSLYNKFARLSAQPTAGESSNGLGLAIVKMLVKSLKGEIELISEPGQGSEFIVRFPLNQAHEDTLKKGVS
jgi:signal transduction histidine kinase